MHSIYSLHVLADQYASAIKKLNPDGDEFKRCSVVLLRLQFQLETDWPSDLIVSECLSYLSKTVGSLQQAN